MLAVSCEHCNEPSGSIENEKCLEQLSVLMACQ
jgi:hypothetical protein